MPNTNFKIVYSLRIHIILEQNGFHYITEMKNPQHPNYNCWVYDATPEFLATFDSIQRELERGSNSG